MVHQFGFVTLFSSAFPLAALCAFINNITEIRRDAMKYTQFTQRAVPKRVRDTGIWQNVFTAIAGLSILTNTLMLSFNFFHH